MVEIEQFTHTVSSSHKYLTSIHQNGVLPVYNYASHSEDMTTDLTLSATHQVANAADINRIQLFIMEYFN
jgi:hypothetical protein